MISNPEVLYRKYKKFYTNRFVNIFEKLVKDFIKEGYSKDKYYERRQYLEINVRQYSVKYLNNLLKINILTLLFLG